MVKSAGCSASDLRKASTARSTFGRSGSSEVIAGSLHGPVPRERTTKRCLQGLDAAFDLLADEGVTEIHALASIRSGLGLPSDAISVGRKILAARDGHDFARPIDFDERHLLLVEPSQDVESDAAAARQA